MGINSVRRVNRFKLIAVIGMIILGAAVGVSGVVLFSDLALAQGEEVETLIHVDDTDVVISYEKNGTEIDRYTDPTDLVRALSISPDGEVAYAGGSDTQVEAFYVDNTTRKWINNDPNNFVYAIDISEDGSVLYVADNDGIVRALHSENGTEIWSTSITTDQLRDLQVTKNDALIITSDSGGSVHAQYPENGSVKWSSAIASENAVRLTVNDAGTLGYIASWDDNAYEFYISNGSATGFSFFVGTNNNAQTVALSEDETVLYIGDRSDNLTAVEISSGNQEWRDSFGGVVRDINPHGGKLYVSSDTDVRRYTEGGIQEWSTTAYINVLRIMHESTNFEVNEESDLRFEVRDFIESNTSIPYTVKHFDGGNWTDVTENATITIENESVIKLNQSSNRLDGQSVNATTNVTAEYEGLQETKEIAVSTFDIKHLQIIPGSYRVTATAGDAAIQVLIVAMLIGGAAARMGTSFFGLGVATMILIIGWYGGWVGTPVMLLGVFCGLFVGLNLAANVDYTVQR